MTSRPLAALCLLLLTAAALAPTTGPAADLRATLDRMAAAQLAVLGDRAPVDWEAATFYAGLSALAGATEDARYWAALRAVADRHAWTPDRGKKFGGFFADDECVCQTFLALYARAPDAAQLTPTRTLMDGLAARLSGQRGGPPATWTWCDALFMAPPAMAHLSALTGDGRYRDAMAAEWFRTAGLLYEPREHLFYRDATFLPRAATRPTTGPAARPVFWSRGNGWVVAGLARVLSYLPANDPNRPRFEAIFRDMTDRLARLQPADGLWRADLLARPTAAPGETSGTALTCYAMAWGIHHGLLDRARFVPVVARAWAGLRRSIRPDGLIGASQPHGYKPAPFTAASTSAFGVGAALLAGSELLPLADVLPTEPAPGATAFVRYVPERFDDIAWENDRIAFRIYGPALEHQEHSSSGVDVWLKSVPQLVVNDWYRRNDYHHDHGQGLDCYEVGHSRGCGGLGVWAGGRLYGSLDWRGYTIDRNGPADVRFTVRYDPWDAAGRRVWESRAIELAAGSNLNRMTSTIGADGPGELTVAIGLAKRAGGARPVQDPASGLLMYWEPPQGKLGSIGTGVLVDPATVVGFAEDADNYLVLVRATPGRPFTYWAGACWSNGRDFHTAAAWEAYLRGFDRGVTAR